MAKVESELVAIAGGEQVQLDSLTFGERYLLVALGEVSCEEALGKQFWFDDEGVINFDMSSDTLPTD